MTSLHFSSTSSIFKIITVALLATAVMLSILSSSSSFVGAAPYSDAVASGGYYFRLDYGTTLLQVSRTNDFSSPNYVCDDYWSTITSNSMCTILGIGDRGAYNTSAPSKPSDSHFLLDNVKCNAGVSSFSQCSYRTTHNCGTYETLGLNCYYYATGRTSGPTWSVRYGANRRFEVRRTSTESTFGTLCDTTGYISYATRYAMCRFLGYQGPSSYAYIGSYGGTDNIRMANLYCSSTAKSLADCTFVTTIPSGCYDGAYQVKVNCGTYAHSSSSSSSSSSDTPIGAIIGGAMFGFFFLMAFVISCAAGACDDDDDDDSSHQPDVVLASGGGGGANDTSSDSSGDDEGEDVRDRQCPICEKVLKTPDGRNSHMRAKHGVDPPTTGVPLTSYPPMPGVGGASNPYPPYPYGGGAPPAAFAPPGYGGGGGAPPPPPAPPYGYPGAAPPVAGGFGGGGYYQPPPHSPYPPQAPAVPPPPPPLPGAATDNASTNNMATTEIPGNAGAPGFFAPPPPNMMPPGWN